MKIDALAEYFENAGASKERITRMRRELVSIGKARVEQATAVKDAVEDAFEDAIEDAATPNLEYILGYIFGCIEMSVVVAVVIRIVLSPVFFH